MAFELPNFFSSLLPSPSGESAVKYTHGKTLGATASRPNTTRSGNSPRIIFVVADFVPVLGIAGGAGVCVVLRADVFGVLVVPFDNDGGVIAVCAFPD